MLLVPVVVEVVVARSSHLGTLHLMFFNYAIIFLSTVMVRGRAQTVLLVFISPAASACDAWHIIRWVGFEATHPPVNA